MSESIVFLFVFLVGMAVGCGAQLFFTRRMIRALREIEERDVAKMTLDPDWARRVAAAALWGRAS